MGIQHISSSETIESLSNEIEHIAEFVKFDSLIILMYTASVVEKYLNISTKKYGQDQTRLNILYLLVGLGGSATPTIISKRVYRSKHAITRAIDLLEKGSLIKRERTSVDRRSINITITQNGLQLVKRSLPELQRATSEAISCLNNTQLMEFKAILKKLRYKLLNLIDESD